MKNVLLNLVGIIALAVSQLLATPLRLLTNADRDKLQHHIAGAWLGLVAAAVALLLSAAPLTAGIAAFTFALGVGFLKEFLDYLENKGAQELGREPVHGVERADAMATWAGAMPVAAPLILLGLLKQAGLA